MKRLHVGIALVGVALFAQTAMGQSSSLLKKSTTEGERPATVSDVSWITFELPEPRTIQKHDILTVLVEERTLVSLSDSFERGISQSVKASLQDWEWMVRGFSPVLGAKDLIRDPGLTGSLSAEKEKEAKLKRSGHIVARMAVKVVDVKPNGTLVIEGKRTISINRITTTYRLAGTVSQEDILGNRTVLSEDIGDFVYDEQHKGKMRDATKRGLLTVLGDLLNLF